LYRTLARCARVDIARGAYKAALEAFPGEWIYLRQKTRIIEESHTPK
jgi:hypothetical protein